MAHAYGHAHTRTYIHTHTYRHTHADTAVVFVNGRLVLVKIRRQKEGKKERKNKRRKE